MTLPYRRAGSLFAALLVLYLGVAAGYVDTIDAEPSVRTARAIVENGTFELHPTFPDEALYYRNRDGGWFTKVGLAMPAIYLPAVAFTHVIRYRLPFPEAWLIAFLVAITNAFITAAVITVLSLYLEKSQPIATARWLAIIAGTATYLFAYSKTAHREPLQSLCLLLAFAPAFGYSYWIAGIGMALGMLTKVGLLVTLLPAGLWCLASAWKSETRRTNLIALAVPVGASAAIWLTFSILCLDGMHTGFTGYGPRVTNFQSVVWYTPFSEGVFRQWFSWREGIFAYSPILFLVFAVAVFCRRERFSPIDLCLTATIALQTSLHAKWFNPLGGSCLGPRYLVVIVPLVFLLARHGRWQWPRSRLARVAVVGIVTYSIALQLVFVAVKPQMFWTMQAAARQTLDVPHWRANLKFFWHKLRFNDEKYAVADFGGDGERVIDLEFARTLIGFNFWWLHYRRLAQTPSTPENPMPRYEPQSIR